MILAEADTSLNDGSAGSSAIGNILPPNLETLSLNDTVEALVSSGCVDDERYRNYPYIKRNVSKRNMQFAHYLETFRAQTPRLRSIDVITYAFPIWSHEDREFIELKCLIAGVSVEFLTQKDTYFWGTWVFYSRPDSSFRKRGKRGKRILKPNRTGRT